MAEELDITLINSQKDWLEPLSDTVQEAVHTAFESAGEAGQKAKNFLHGTWLGHPLHAAITDVPLGAWTAALVMDACEDLTGKKELGRGADTAIAIGLVGAVASAAAGLTDWSDSHGRGRRIGAVHGIMNLAGAGLYAGALVARRKDARKVGRGLSLLGFAVSMGAAYLGGKLTYSEQLGADHTVSLEFPEEFTPVMADGDLAEGQMKAADLPGGKVLLARHKGELCAIADKCSHLGGPLSEGQFEDGCVTCPWHGSTFNVHDGSVVNGPAVHPQPQLEVRVNNGQIEVKGPSAEERPGW